MSEHDHNQETLEGALELLSAGEDPVAPHQVGGLDTEQVQILSEWSAQDFANIYVRFRPHLLSHAQKYLADESQAEEAVQDAFLYLMTALPELDSELGVLRFLKWKTKMLCLDVIRASKAGVSGTLTLLPDDLVDHDRVAENLERADDAAVIALALAKLSARHREALIATLYEEKSHEEVSRQMGLKENAFRQLLFRARSAMKTALVGELETRGKSINEILIAASKRAANSSMTPALLILVATLAFGSFFTSGNSPITLAESPQTSFSNETRFRPSDLEASPQDLDIGRGLELGANGDSESIGVSNEEDLGELATSFEATESSRAEQIPEPGGGDVELEFRDQQFRAQLASFLQPISQQLPQDNSALSFAEVGGLISIAIADRVTAHIALSDYDNQPIQYSIFEIETDVGPLIAVPRVSLTSTSFENGQTTLTYAATDFLIGDYEGTFGFISDGDAEMARKKVVINLIFSANEVVQTTAYWS